MTWELLDQNQTQIIVREYWKREFGHCGQPRKEDRAENNTWYKVFAISLFFYNLHLIVPARGFTYVVCVRVCLCTCTANQCLCVLCSLYV